MLGVRRHAEGVDSDAARRTGCQTCPSASQALATHSTCNMSPSSMMPELSSSPGKSGSLSTICRKRETEGWNHVVTLSYGRQKRLSRSQRRT